MCGGDAAFCRISLTICLLLLQRVNEQPQRPVLLRQKTEPPADEMTSNTGVFVQQNCQMDATCNVSDSSVTVAERDAIRPVWCSPISRLSNDEDQHVFEGQETNSTKPDCNSNTCSDVQCQTPNTKAECSRPRPNPQSQCQNFGLRADVKAKVLALRPKFKLKFWHTFGSRDLGRGKVKAETSVKRPRPKLRHLFGPRGQDQKIQASVIRMNPEPQSYSVVEASTSLNACSQMFGQSDRRKKYVEGQQIDHASSKHSDDTCDQVSDKSSSVKHPSYKCVECHRTFSNQRYLKTHKLIHASDKPYVCDLCSKSFTICSYLTKHKRTHSGQKPYICYICNKVFSELGHLTAHVLIHTGYKRHVCDVCRKAFTNASTLTTHRRIHSGERPFKCRTCGVSFSQSSALTLHLRTHTGERPYVCDVCSRAFSNSSHLARHKRGHSGLRPYTCVLCNKSFTASSSLSTHKRMVHRCTD